MIKKIVKIPFNSKKPTPERYPKQPTEPVKKVDPYRTFIHKFFPNIENEEEEKWKRIIESIEKTQGYILTEDETLFSTMFRALKEFCSGMDNDLFKEFTERFYRISVGKKKRCKVGPYTLGMFIHKITRTTKEMKKKDAIKYFIDKYSELINAKNQGEFIRKTLKL